MDTEIKSLWKKLFQKLSTMKSDGKILNVAGEEINPATTENIETLTQEVTTQGEAIIAAVQNSGGVTYKSFEVTLEGPVSPVAYAAGDVLADKSAAFLPFLNVAKANGTGVKIVRVRIQTEDSAVGGTKFNLHLYKEAPTFIADNGVFAIFYANASKRVGVFPVVMGTGTLATVGANDWNQIILNPTARDIYFILETVTGFTPTKASAHTKIIIDCELSNN